MRDSALKAAEKYYRTMISALGDKWMAGNKEYYESTERMGEFSFLEASPHSATHHGFGYSGPPDDHDLEGIDIVPVAKVKHGNAYAELEKSDTNKIRSILRSVKIRPNHFDFSQFKGVNTLEFETHETEDWGEAEDLLAAGDKLAVALKKAGYVADSARFSGDDDADQQKGTAKTFLSFHIVGKKAGKHEGVEFSFLESKFKHKKSKGKILKGLKRVLQKTTRASAAKANASDAGMFEAIAYAAVGQMRKMDGIETPTGADPDLEWHQHSEVLRAVQAELKKIGVEALTTAVSRVITELRKNKFMATSGNGKGATIALTGKSGLAAFVEKMKQDADFGSDRKLRAQGHQ